MCVVCVCVVCVCVCICVCVIGGAYHRILDLLKTKVTC